MKATIPHSIKIILIFFCLFNQGNNYSQGKNPTNKTLFGKSITTKSKNPKNGVIRCATVEYEQYLQKKNPKRMSNAQFENWLSPLVAKQKAMRSNSKTAATIITIPVVVHIIHNGEAIGTAPNIIDAQVQSQITVLNQDFRRMIGTNGDNTNPVGADVEIQFVLAKQDPNGNPTNGIDRVNMCQSTWSDTDINEIVKPSTIWDPNQYLNMWALKFTENKILGYAQFPNSSSLQGIEAYEGDANTDGVVSSFDVFGSSDYGSNFLLVPFYDKARTMTHEVGHWLGLRHIWGDGNGDESLNTPDCSASDFCADTPQAGWENYGCPTTPYDSCPTVLGNDMVENYMDYTEDLCMNIFTNDQKARIMTVMTNSPRRVSLKTSTKGTALTPFAIDAEVKTITDYCTSNITDCASLPAPTNKNVTLTNRGTSPLTSARLTYSMNGTPTQTQTWTGSLTQNQSAIVTLLNTAVNGLLNVNIDTANGTTDQRPSNNTDSKSYSPVNYNFTNYIFKLQQDFWGDEITWNLKNGAGEELYKGGPYSGKPSEVLPLPALITQNWTLANNQCYTFTINDSESDGICCGGGNGYYNLKSSDGTTIASGSSFGQKDVTFFTINSTLGTNSFETLNAIYLYPNPTNDIINVSVPNEHSLPNSLTLNNSLGQIISRKEVSSKTDLSINTSALSKGVYFITITKETQTKTLQFIKE